jgi:hypothetical protein
VTCRKVKTKCSYTASHTARRHELKAAGELKGKQKAGGKKTVKSEGNETPRTATKRKRRAETTSSEESGEEYIPITSTSPTPRRIPTPEPARSTDEPMLAGDLKAKKKAVEKKRVKAAESEGLRTAPKRKHPAEATTGDQSGEYIPVGPAPGPSTSRTSGRIPTPEPARSTAITEPQSPDTTTLPACITHPGCVPTITGLQREHQDLHVIILHLAKNQEQLRQENITLRGSLEVLQTLKEKCSGAGSRDEGIEKWDGAGEDQGGG